MEVTKKNVKRQEAGRKAYQTHLQKVKEDILKNSTSNSTTRGSDRGSNSPSDSSSSTISSSDRGSDSTSTVENIYHYGKYSLAILAVIGLIGLFFQKKKSPHKKPIKKKQRRGML